MKKHRVVLLCIMTLLLFSLFISPTAQAALDVFGLSWWTVDSGGGQSQGASYSLLGVAGQPDAHALQGGSFVLAGGYLSGVTVPPPPTYNISLPLLIK